MSIHAARWFVVVSFAGDDWKPLYGVPREQAARDLAAALTQRFGGDAIYGCPDFDVIAANTLSGPKVLLWRNDIAELRYGTLPKPGNTTLRALCAEADELAKGIDYPTLHVPPSFTPQDSSDSDTPTTATAQAAVVPAGPGVSGDAPTPSDLSDYMPAIECRTEAIITHKQLLAFLERHAEIPTVHPSKQRLFVHAGKWQAAVREAEAAKQKVLIAVEDSDELADAFDAQAKLRTTLATAHLKRKQP